MDLGVILLIAKSKIKIKLCSNSSNLIIFLFLKMQQVKSCLFYLKKKILYSSYIIKININIILINLIYTLPCHYNNIQYSAIV